MKVEGWLFLGCGIFFGGADIVYWYTSKEVTGTAALAFAVGLALLTGFYVLFTGRRLPKRPEDDNAAAGARLLCPGVCCPWRPAVSAGGRRASWPWPG